MSNVLALSDQQEPFGHRDYLMFALELRREFRCDLIVSVGDELDNHMLSDYDKDPDGMSGGHEVEAAIEKLLPFYKAFPKMMLCYSNHSGRIYRKAMQAGISKRWIKSIPEVIGSPKNWKWKRSWEIDGVKYLHGLGYSGRLGALNAAIDNHKPCVIGHLHSDAGILYVSNGDNAIWGMNVGCGIDAKAYAFKYGIDMRKKPVLGAGIIRNGSPIFVEMKCNKRGRWTGDF